MIGENFSVGKIKFQRFFIFAKHIYGELKMNKWMLVLLLFLFPVNTFALDVDFAVKITDSGGAADKWIRITDSGGAADEWWYIAGGCESTKPSLWIRITDSGGAADLWVRITKSISASDKIVCITNLKQLDNDVIKILTD
jgi:hypothetical protein